MQLALICLLNTIPLKSGSLLQSPSIQYKTACVLLSINYGTREYGLLTAAGKKWIGAVSSPCQNNTMIVVKYGQIIRTAIGKRWT